MASPKTLDRAAHIPAPTLRKYICAICRADGRTLRKLPPSPWYACQRCVKEAGTPAQALEQLHRLLREQGVAV